MRIEYNNTWFVVGKSAEENWKIISLADKDYYWVHAADIPSSHVVIEVDIPLDDEIQYACRLCKEQTKKIKDYSTKYIITKIKNIKLGSKPGEVYFKDKLNVNLVQLKKPEI
jgi:predicted ribosome quality control (RQC) complex YloA/Tae2 family protein